MICPDRERFLREAAITRRRSKEEDFLTGRADALADHFGKERSQPRPTGEDKAISRQPTAIRQWHRGKFSCRWLQRSLDRELPVLPTFSRKPFQHGRTGPPRRGVPALCCK